MAALNKRATKPFTMVRRDIWNLEPFRGLPDDGIRYLYFYFLTCTHLTGCGCFLLKEGYALTDLGMTGADWSPGKYREAKAILVQTGMIQTDEKTEEILITRWWDHQNVNDSWLNGAQKNVRGDKVRCVEGCR